MKDQGVQLDKDKIKSTTDKLESLRKEMRAKEHSIFEIKMELKKQEEA